MRSAAVIELLPYQYFYAVFGFYPPEALAL